MILLFQFGPAVVAFLITIVIGPLIYFLAVPEPFGCKPPLVSIVVSSIVLGIGWTLLPDYPISSPPQGGGPQWEGASFFAYQKATVIIACAPGAGFFAGGILGVFIRLYYRY